jgi:gamma-butyrobetaine dioxygenase
MFHHLWLRDNCPCPTCRHQSVPERLVDTLSIADDVAPASAVVSADGGLDVTWAAGWPSTPTTTDPGRRLPTACSGPTTP